jgi:hypothetical protein
MPGEAVERSQQISSREAAAFISPGRKSGVVPEVSKSRKSLP